MHVGRIGLLDYEAVFPRVHEVVSRRSPDIGDFIGDRKGVFDRRNRFAVGDQEGRGAVAEVGFHAGLRGGESRITCDHERALCRTRLHCIDSSPKRGGTRAGRARMVGGLNRAPEVEDPRD